MLRPSPVAVFILSAVYEPVPSVFERSPTTCTSARLVSAKFWSFELVLFWVVAASFVLFILVLLAANSVFALRVSANAMDNLYLIIYSYFNNHYYFVKLYKYEIKE